MRAYITGIGIYSSLGKNVSEMSENLLAGKSAVIESEELKQSGFKYHKCAPVPPVDKELLPQKRRVKSLLTQMGQYAYVAAKEALTMAGQTDILDGTCKRNVGVIVSCDENIQQPVDTHSRYDEYGVTQRLSVYDAFKNLSSNVAIMLTNEFAIPGMALTINAACSGGLHAVALADKLVRSEVLDGCLVVGAQETGPIAWCAFDTLGMEVAPSGGAAATYIDNELRYRGSLGGILGSIHGYGTSVSRSVAQPSYFAELMAIERAFEHSSIQRSDINLINGHMTGTVIGNDVELQAIRSALDMLEYERPMVLSNKRYHGHELSMSGVSQIVESIACYKGKNILVNAFGFGGNNASLILKTNS